MKFEKYNSDYFKYKCVSNNTEIYVCRYSDINITYYVSIKQGLEMKNIGSFMLRDATIDSINKEATACVKSYIKTITGIKAKFDKAVKEKTEFYAMGAH